MQWLKRQWQENGTKMLGYLGIAFGALSVLDAATIEATTKILGPTWGPVFKASCVMAGAMAVAARGHKNTAEIAKEMVDKTTTTKVVAAARVVDAVAKKAVEADDKDPTGPAAK